VDGIKVAEAVARGLCWQANSP